MKILIASKPENLAAVNPHVTVEAEYGDTVVEGSLLTLAHHGPRSGNDAPCIADVPERVLPPGDSIIGISHVDLDTVGGISRVIGAAITGGASDDAFWGLAAFVDVNGPHRIMEAGTSLAEVDLIYSYWAWAKDHRVFAPRDGSVADVTEQVMEHIEMLGNLLNYGTTEDRNALIDAGMSFRAEEAVLNRDSLHGIVTTPKGKVALRSAPAFTNHLYTSIDGIVCDAVLALKEDVKSLTLSFSGDQGNACEIMQEVFGPEAGGHAGIAGTPRDKEYTFDDIDRVLDEMV